MWEIFGLDGKSLITVICNDAQFKTIFDLIKQQHKNAVSVKHKDFFGGRLLTIS